MHGKEDNVVYFRGDLKVTINSASNLPNADGRNIKAKFDNLMSKNKNKKKDLSGSSLSRTANLLTITLYSETLLSRTAN